MGSGMCVFLRKKEFTSRKIPFGNNRLACYFMDYGERITDKRVASLEASLKDSMCKLLIFSKNKLPSKKPIHNLIEVPLPGKCYFRNRIERDELLQFLDNGTSQIASIAVNNFTGIMPEIVPRPFVGTEVTKSIVCFVEERCILGTTEIFPKHDLYLEYTAYACSGSWNIIKMDDFFSFISKNYKIKTGTINKTGLGQVTALIGIGHVDSNETWSEPDLLTDEDEEGDASGSDFDDSETDTPLQNTYEQMYNKNKRGIFQFTGPSSI
jgi:hypothetical protein